MAFIEGGNAFCACRAVLAMEGRHLWTLFIGSFEVWVARFWTGVGLGRGSGGSFAGYCSDEEGSGDKRRERHVG